MTPLPRGEVLVESGSSGFANSVRAGAHHLLVDEPANVGGTDTGPSPYEYVLGALGGCTSMTLRMYADRKGGHSKAFECGSPTRRLMRRTAVIVRRKRAGLTG